MRDDSGLVAGRNADAALSDAVMERFVAGASPITDVRGSREYRAAMLPVFLRRTFRTATDRLHGA